MTFQLQEFVHLFLAGQYIYLLLINKIWHLRFLFNPYPNPNLILAGGKETEGRRKRNLINICPEIRVNPLYDAML